MAYATKSMTRLVLNWFPWRLKSSERPKMFAFAMFVLRLVSSDHLISRCD